MVRRVPALHALVWFSTLAGCGGDDGGTTTEDDVGDTAGTDDTGETADTDGTDTGPELDPNLAEIPGGTFDMGCVPADVECDDDGQPAHPVTVSPFWLEVTEVTASAYTACVDDGGCTAATEGAPCSFGNAAAGDHPINCVTWQQATDYCAWAGRRLPTEAEWEFAARGTSGRLFPWGSAEATCDFAHMYQMFTETSVYGCDTDDTAVVGSYPDGVGPYGNLDLSGNVEEWIADWYSETWYAESPAMDPVGPPDGMMRVVRGGDWYDASAYNLRTVERARSVPTVGAPERGFRCAADQNP